MFIVSVTEPTLDDMHARDAMATVRCEHTTHLPQCELGPARGGDATCKARDNPHLILGSSARC